MRAFSLLSLILFATATTLCCGNSQLSGLLSSRQLQSITITQAANGQKVEFVATGNFSAPPTTVTPLSVDWGVGPFAPPPGNLDYQLTSKPFSLQCSNSGSYLPIMAWAPPNPNAPASGSLPFKSMVIASATPNCP